MKDVIGRVSENIGIGLFVNGTYGMVDGSIEIYNIIDIFISLYIMVGGILLQRRKV